MHVHIFDTTTRDGEQAPGCTMTFDAKMEILERQKRLNVDVIEAGFPTSIPEDFAQVQAIAKQCDKYDDPVVCALSRLLKEDIDAAFDAIKPAKRQRIHVFIATSPIQMRTKWGRSGESDEEIANRIYERICNLFPYIYQRATSQLTEIEFSAEDATRSDWNFLVKVFQAAIDGGATILNVPDTCGYAVPDEYYELFTFLISNLKTKDGLPIKDALENGSYVFSAHCHNDQGLAVANSLAAVQAGARQIECTIGGIGERAGNTAMEEFVMALRNKKDRYKVDTQIVTQEFMSAAQVVAKYTQWDVAINKPIIGRNAFAHEAGIHAKAVIDNPLTYEIMNPEDVGNKRHIDLGKHSGRGSVRYFLSERGLLEHVGVTDIERMDAIARISNKISSFAAQANRSITETDILRIIAQSELDVKIPVSVATSSQIMDLLVEKKNFIFPYKFNDYDIEDDEVTVFMEIKGSQVSKTVNIDHENSAINGIFKAMHALSGMQEVKLGEVNLVSSADKSSESVAIFKLEVYHGKDLVEVQDQDTNINKAFGKAVARAFNRLLLKLLINEKLSLDA